MMSATTVPQHLAEQRQYLYLYAKVRLRDADLAEDVVQETMVAALEALPTFQEKSSLRTWVVAIMRNKMADALRAGNRLVRVNGGADEEVGDEDVESLFDRRGMWHGDTRPRTWEQPEAALEQQQFWSVFENCLCDMPHRTAEVFALREVLGESIDAICKNLEVTPTNCSVMLYRARMRLRTCLDKNWFAGASRTG